ncbi:Hypothetical predicted protein [Lecanosticta acicola]|uniref:SnoaL-like domain-containing protein n=1 Tax=Lecanosticta acicola TaxID=111012 RepID=A0AAI8Z337_9PEZI|nr:Hypothetical predicted protein [Lecanosticta acicola]
MPPYPTKPEIEELCSALATSDTSPFFSRVSPNVTWDVMGTHPAAGHFTTLQAWKDGALGAVQTALDGPLALKPTNVCGGGEQEWAAVELEANATCKNGMPYNQRYVWMLRFDKSGTIVQARAYLDSALVQKAMVSNP